ncbi:FRG domain-containing protein, partial [bacterium]
DSNTIKNLGDFVNWVSQVSNEWKKYDQEWKKNEGKDTRDDPAVKPWFRGLASSTYKLTPSIVYQNNISIERLNEVWFNKIFKEKAPKYLSHIPNETEYGKWLFLMRHYSAPSRLLDWSESALIALFFALTEKPEKEDQNPAVWMLHPFMWNKIMHNEWSVSGYLSREIKWEFKSLFNENGFSNIKFAKSIRPPLIDSKMLAQKSVFVLFGDNNDCMIDQFKRKNENENGMNIRNVIRKKVIPNLRKNDLLEELATLGITHQSVEPNLTGLAMELSFRFYK